MDRAGVQARARRVRRLVVDVGGGLAFVAGVVAREMEWQRERSACWDEAGVLAWFRTVGGECVEFVTRSRK